MNEETAGLDFAALSLRQRDPIGGGDRFDPERPKTVATCGLSDQSEQSVALRWRLVMSEDLEAAGAPLEQSERHRGRVDRLFKRLGDAHCRRCRGLDAGLMDCGARLPP